MALKPWPKEKFPLGCVFCGRDDGKIARVDPATCGACFSRQRRAALKARTAAPVADVASFIDAPADAPTFGGGESRPGSGTSPDSVTESGSPPPVEPEKKRTLRDRLSGKPPVDRTQGRPKIDTADGATPPGGPRTKRKALADDFEKLLFSVGERMTRVDVNSRPMGKHYSTGLWFKWKAAETAEVIDENIKYTYVDNKVLQPLSKSKDRVGAIGSVLAPPLIIMAIEAQPERINVLYPMLYFAIESSLEYLVPAQKKAEARAKKREQVLKDAFGDENFPDGVDPVQYLIEQLFPWITIEQPPANEGVQDAVA